MMKNVALVALLSAPAVLAFIPADLEGVWSCVPEDGEYYTAKQTFVADLNWEHVDDDSSHRVVVFDKPASKATRTFHGRTYYTAVADQIEEHEIRGHFTNALQADFYSSPNANNPECAAAAQVGVCITGDNCLAALSVPLPIGQLTKSAIAEPTWDGSCKDHPAGPFQFVMDDADHFSLTLDTKDQQANHNTATDGVWNHAHVFVVEKCMRGLPEKDEMCDNLQRSGITNQAEMDEACQGALTCEYIDSDTIADGRHCTIPVPVYAPQPYYQPQYYQPQYYQPQTYQPQANYQPYVSPSYTPQWFG